VIQAIDLSKRYGNAVALDGFNLAVGGGEIYCPLGANGAGKTTTINLFLNFVQPTAGAALINGLDVAKQPLETKKHLAYIPETVTLHKNLSGLERLYLEDMHD
jgi:ABC-2 type transport system ATP-binding protein